MNRATASIVQLAITILFGFSGCSPAPQPTSDRPAKPVDHVAPGDLWDVYYMQGKRIGYAHTTITPQRNKETDGATLRVERTDHLSVQRDGQTTRQDIRTISVETPQGTLIRFECEMQMGPSPIRTTGRVEDNRLLLETTTAGSSAPSRNAVRWPAGGMGPLAVEQTLRRRPMQPGRRRTLKMLVVGLNQAAEVEMNAKDYEPTQLPDGTHDLLRIETVTRLSGGQAITGQLWTDRNGETLKTSSAMLGGLESYRTDKATALDRAERPELDLMAGTMVKVDQPLADASRTKRVRYRVHLDAGDPSKAFAAGPTQSVEAIDPHTAELTVYAIRLVSDVGNPDAPAEPATEADLAPNSYLQSDDPVIVADAEEAVSGQTDPWEAAKALESYVHRKVKNKTYAQTFATAADVARSLEGDCTEHAVYLAALARARGIPARVAMGLVYMEPKQAFGYHMWTEVYVDGRWLPIDGTVGQGGVGAGYLKLGDANLQGASIYNQFLPVLELLGQLRIEVLDAQ